MGGNEGVAAETSKERGGKSNSAAPLYKLFTFADGLDVVLMSVGTVAAMTYGLAFPLGILIFGQLIDSFGYIDHSNFIHAVTKLSLRFVYLAIGTGIAAFLQFSSWMITGERQAARIRGLYLKAILGQDIAYFDKYTSVGEVIGSMSGDTVLIQDAIGEKVGKFIQLITLFIGGFAIAFMKGWLLVLVMLASFPLVVLAGAAMSITISNISKRGQAAYTDAGNVVEQTLGAIRTVASFTGEMTALAKYDKSLEAAYRATIQEGYVTGIGIGILYTIIFSSYSLGMWYSSRLIVHNGYTGGTVLDIIFCLMMGGTSLGQASPCVNAFASGTTAAYKMLETINRKPEINVYDNFGIVLEDIRGDIELRDVNFSYPSRPKVEIFSGFSLKVPSGMAVALVGESGSGKSTVISLIERFYDPQSGEVLIDGINLKALQLQWIREKIGLVSQEPVLFMTTIKENIGYAKAEATDTEIKKAAELANAMKFIETLPQGFDTMVGENGAQLSGGQKQRIAIARAILKDPKILLLDEATSALDVESEKVVQDALSNIMVGRTTVLVAHRLSTIRNADTIAVVHQGKIVEKGTHSELIQNATGSYSQLVRMQDLDQTERLSYLEGDDDDDDIHAASEIGKVSSVSGRNRYSFNLPASRDDKAHDSISDGINGGDTSDDTKNTASLHRLAELNKPEVPILVLGCIAAAANGLVFPVFGILLSGIVTIFYEPARKLERDAEFWSLMFLALGAGNLLATTLQKYLFGIAGGKLIWRIRLSSFDKVIHQEIGWFDEPSNSSGAIGARLSVDAATVRNLVGDSLSLNVQNISTIIAGLMIAFVTNWELALILLSLAPLIGLQGFMQMKLLKGFSADGKVMYEEASKVANDAVSNIRTVASSSAEERVLDLYKRKCELPKKNGIRQGMISGMGYGFSLFLVFSAAALMFYIAGRLINEGKTTFVKFFRVFMALILAAIGVAETSALAPDLAKARLSAASIFAIIDRKSKIDASDVSGLTLESVNGDVVFKHVSFRYPARPEVQIFRDMSLDVPSGKTVALVGESGSGKSTVISLLQRFYDPDSGNILLDGVEIQKLQLRWLRQQMGLVSQEPVLFNDSIRANIAYGKLGAASEEEILAAAKVANAHQFISALPQGYDTMVGDRGIQISGGQKQRVAIARALIKKPKILLLDEATCALDAESERLVQETLDSVMVSRTAIVIAHRLSTIKGADEIAVVKNGKVAEKGSHENLMNIKSGLYASLVALQMSAPSS